MWHHRDTREGNVTLALTLLLRAMSKDATLQLGSLWSKKQSVRSFLSTWKIGCRLKVRVFNTTLHVTTQIFFTLWRRVVHFFCSSLQHRRMIINQTAFKGHWFPVVGSFFLLWSLLFYSSLFIVNQYSIIQKRVFNTHQRWVTNHATSPFILSKMKDR